MEKVERLGMNDERVSTRLLEKHYSPMIIRKYQAFGWPLWIGLIMDVSCSDLDELIHKLLNESKENGLYKQDLQAMRNLCGYLNDNIVSHYNLAKTGSVEGVAVFLAIDKTYISSLWGDFMVHAACKQEFFLIVNTTPHI